MPTLDNSVRPFQSYDLTYRIECRRCIEQPGHHKQWSWKPVSTSAGLGKRTFWYETDAVEAVEARSRKHPTLEYRITRQTGPLPGFWRAGVRYDVSIDDATQQNEEVVQVTKPLSVPRTTVIASMVAEDKRLREQHEAEQAELAEAYAGKLAKIEGLADKPFLILAMVEACTGKSITSFQDTDEVVALLARKYGQQPGTTVYETPEALSRLINVYSAATDPEIEVQPEDNVYHYLAAHPVDTTASDTAA